MRKFLSLILAVLLTPALFSCTDGSVAGTSEQSLTEKAPDTAVSASGDGTTEAVTTAGQSPEHISYTREELEKALITTAVSYFVKGKKIQYDSTNLEKNITSFYGGRILLDYVSPPEDATDDRTTYSVCSDYMFKIYLEGIGYHMFGADKYIDMHTTAMGYLCQGKNATGDSALHTTDMLLARFVKEGRGFSETEQKNGVHTVDGIDMTRDEFYSYMSNYKNNLRAGDVIVAGYDDSGHAMMYCGNGYMIECTGKKYDLTTGVDSVESTGSLVLSTFEDFFLNGKRANYYIKNTTDKQREWFIVLRPLNLICADDGDGNPGNDLTVSTFGGIPESTVTRMENPGLDINRTSSIHMYGTAVKGENVTYTVKINNQSYYRALTAFLKADDASYAGQKYGNLTVTETIPAGSELVYGSITGGGEYKDGTITWNIPGLGVGSSVTLEYTVRVTGDIGTMLVNDGGFVGNIPSNTLKNRIGAGKAASTDEAFLKDFKEARLIISALFSSKQLTLQRYGKTPGGASVTKNAILLNDRSAVADEYKPYYDMLIYGYIGGKGFHCDVNGDYYKEYREDNLQPGDILIYSELNALMKQQSGTQEMYLYLGNKNYLYRDSDGKITTVSGDSIASKAHMHGLFFALRPGQAG